MPLITLERLYDDPRNANVCTPETLDKIRLNIERTGLCPPLIVRPHSEQADAYMIIDGHHRKRVLESLGWKAVECQIWDLPETEVLIALATLNQLRGTDNIRLRAELIQSLAENIAVEDLATLLPETACEIQDMLKLLEYDFEMLEKNLKAQMEKEESQLPVVFSFLVPAQDAMLVNEVLESFKARSSKKQADRGLALVEMCRFVKNAQSHHRE